MNPTEDLSFLSLILNASLIVQLVMLILITMSIASWTVIFKKGSILRGVRRDTERFERDFWSGGDLNTLLEAAQRNNRSSAVMERIFAGGMLEFSKAREIDAARRAMKATYQREMDILEANLPFLASVGSVSPYIGLFGTVWGIMHAFKGLANVQNATLAAVAVHVFMLCLRNGQPARCGRDTCCVRQQPCTVPYEPGAMGGSQQGSCRCTSH